MQEPPQQDALARALALGVLSDATLGDRLVVRARHGDGAQDALGTLTARTADTVTIETRRGPSTSGSPTSSRRSPCPRHPRPDRVDPDGDVAAALAAGHRRAVAVPAAAAT
ncbi:hypothetical protein [Curtobacterium sp. TXMA1]|uniref:hypothetical protein n=1 Tax=Curtobacterium sp. TXMA1 TaxID=2876939 RepID=UPI001CCCD4E5|nr:hypothetical protein [Curtobacterium sp. TXMA1]UBQ03750.1 hypothetical protein LCG91_06205 [Curtobacterium sp. TXMA1]